LIRALNTAATGMDSQQTQIDIIANNMANVNTTAFKKARAEFQDLYYQQIRAATDSSDGESSTPVGLEVGNGVRVVSSQKMFTQGDMIQTGNKFDMAIEGEGFFKVLLPNGGYAYTRAGNFDIDADGRLVTKDGAQLYSPVQLPEGFQTVTINRQGVVQVQMQGQDELTTVGQVTLAGFQNPAGLRSEGRGTYLATASSGQAFESTPGQNGLGNVSHQQLESSNVKVVQEMIDLISAQRAYEINSRVVQAADQMLRESSNVGR